MNISRLPSSKTILYLGVSIIIFIILRVTGALAPIEVFFQVVTAPISAPIYSTGAKINSFLSKPRDLESLQEENEKLRSELTFLKQDISELQTAKQENETLRNLLDFFEQDSTDMKSVISRIVGRDPENPSILHLNTGARDGIEVGNAVIIEEGILVAKIVEVQPRSSKALILTAPGSQVAVSISGGAPSSKLASGERGLSIILDQIPQQELITKGELVITSGLEPKIPNGLLVGEIEEIISEKNDLFQRAILRPLADNESIQIVAIVLTPFES